MALRSTFLSKLPFVAAVLILLANNAITVAESAGGSGGFEPIDPPVAPKHQSNPSKEIIMRQSPEGPDPEHHMYPPPKETIMRLSPEGPDPKHHEYPPPKETIMRESPEGPDPKHHEYPPPKGYAFEEGTRRIDSAIDFEEKKDVLIDHPNGHKASFNEKKHI